jgi:hypothetical protein
VASRLRARLTRIEKVESNERTLAEDFARDLEEDTSELETQAVVEPEPSPAENRIRAELEQVERFAKRSSSLPHDSKARCLLDALRIVREHASRDQGTGRAIVFTESLTTQGYLRDLLLENGYRPEDITLFRGDNETPEARAALDQWEKEVASSLPSREPAEPRSGVEAGTCPRVSRALAGVHFHRGRGQGPEPAVLRHADQLRLAVESSAD